MTEYKFSVKQISPRPIPNIPGATKASFYLPVSELPLDFPSFNVRAQNLQAKVYVNARDTLINGCNQQAIFGLLNRGITIIADSVMRSVDGQSITITLNNGSSSGVIDGGHTYALLRVALNNLLEGSLTRTQANILPEQYVEIEVLAGVPEELRANGRRDKK